MGSKGKKTTVGYKYFMDIHAGLGRGPVNEIVNITADEKIILAAEPGQITTSKSIYINKPDLFGGTDTSGEGGIDGLLEIAMGYADQVPSSLVRGLLSGIVPGFRGMVTTFFSGLISAYSASPKPWVYRVRRSTRGWDGDVVWYPEKAVITLRNDDSEIDDASLNAAQLENLRQIHSMNGAHILVECATNRDWGRGLALSELELDTYKTAADTLFNEAFGLCFRYNRQENLNAFVQQVLDHIGAVQYADLGTGKLNLKLIRKDYNPDDLPLFDYDSGILSVQDDDASAADVAANEIVATWHDPLTNNDKEVRAQNLGSIQSVGLISESVSYKAIPTYELAARVAERDLEAVTAGLSRFVLKFDRRGGTLIPAACFRLSLDDRGINNMVMRVGKISENDDGSLTITAIQDVFGLPSTNYSSVKQKPAWTPPDSAARPVTAQCAVELPYATLVTLIGTAELATLTDDTGYLGVIAEAPQTNAINYTLQTNAGGGWTAGQTGDWTPSALLLSVVGRSDTMLNIHGPDGLEIGSAVLIDDEIVRIDAVDSETGMITIGRGCADTVPALHAAGNKLWFYDGQAESNGIEYVAGEKVYVRLLTRTAAALLTPNLATVSAVTMASRQARPYPPGDVRVNELARLEFVHGTPFKLSWVGRNRVIQADNLVSHSEPGVMHEDGTEYVIRLYHGDELVRVVTQTESVWSYPEPVEPVKDMGGTEEPIKPVWEAFNSITLHAMRDGLESMQGYTLTAVDS